MFDDHNKLTRSRDAVLIMKSDRFDELEEITKKNQKSHLLVPQDCNIYNINMIMKLCSYQDKFQRNFPGEGIIHKFESEYNKMSAIRRSKYIFQKVDEILYYISIPKDWCPSKTAKGRFRIYENEFLNLTFLNSVELSQILSNCREESIKLGAAELPFAQAKKYLQAAVAYTEERESQVATWLQEISPEITQDSEWPVKLSAWMIQKNVHRLSRYRIKQFINSLKR